MSAFLRCLVNVRGASLALVAAAAALGACGGSSAADGLPAGDDDAGGASADDDGGGARPADDASPAEVDAAGDASADAAIENHHLGTSSGCGKAGATTGAQTVTIKVSGVTRSYIRVVPASYTASNPMDLVFAFHGSGGTATGARTSFDLESHAGGKAIFVYPQGLPSTDPAFLGVNRWDPSMGSRDYAFVDAVKAAIEDAYCVDRDKVFAAGFSNGAEMTTMLGCYRGDVLRAVAPVAPGGSGAPITSATCVGEAAVWEGLGDADPDHVMGATATRAHYLKANGCSSTTSPTTPAGCEAYQGCRPEAPVVWCSYPGGHMWPPIGGAGVMGFFESFP